MFGGAGDAALGTLGDTWEWDGANWVNVAESGPPARWGHCMAFDESRGVTVVFGGEGQDGQLLGDTWEWDGQSWARQTGASPPARRAAAAVYCGERGSIILIGGTGDSGAAKYDVWEYLSGQWSRLPWRSPRSFVSAASGYDPRLRMILCWGGVEPADSPNTYDSSIWMLDSHGRWRRLSADGPVGRVGIDNALTYDSERDRFVLFGGFVGPVNSETWELRIDKD